MTTLTLVRHGQTDWNARRLIQGSTDIPLNEVGRSQALDVAERLRIEPPADAPTVVASSDLSRAQETARTIARVLGVAEPRSYPALRERNYGDAEGVNVDEYRARWGDWTTADVPNAESWPHLRARAVKGLRHIVRDARRATAPVAPNVVVVAHGALIREVIRHASSGAFPQEGERLANASTHTFLIERDRLSLLSYAALPLG